MCLCKNKAPLKICICQAPVFAKSDGWGRTVNDTKSHWMNQKEPQSYGSGQDTKLNSVTSILDNKHCVAVVEHNKKADGLISENSRSFQYLH